MLLSPGPHMTRSRLRRRWTTSFEFFHLPAWTRSLISPAAETIPRIFRIMDTSAVTARTVEGMASLRFGQAPALPLVSDRSVRSGLRGQTRLRVYVDRYLSTCAGCPAGTVALGAGGADTSTERAIFGSDLFRVSSPPRTGSRAQRQITVSADFSESGHGNPRSTTHRACGGRDLQIHSSMCWCRASSYQSVTSVASPSVVHGRSESPERRPPRWLPAWLSMSEAPGRPVRQPCPPAPGARPDRHLTPAEDAA
jgi:hypothetical protein